MNFHKNFNSSFTSTLTPPPPNPWLTLTYFMARSNLVTFGLEWENYYKVIKWEKLAANNQIKRRITFILRKNMTLKVFCPCLGDIYMYMTIIFKHLFLWSHLANQSHILCGTFMGKGNVNFVKNGHGSHDQNGRHVHIFKNLLKNWKLGKKLAANDKFTWRLHDCKNRKKRFMFNLFDCEVALWLQLMLSYPNRTCFA